MPQLRRLLRLPERPADPPLEEGVEEVSKATVLERALTLNQRLSKLERQQRLKSIEMERDARGG